MKRITEAYPQSRAIYVDVAINNKSYVSLPSADQIDETISGSTSCKYYGAADGFRKMVAIPDQTAFQRPSQRMRSVLLIALLFPLHSHPLNIIVQKSAEKGKENIVNK